MAEVFFEKSGRTGEGRQTGNTQASCRVLKRETDHSCKLKPSDCTSMSRTQTPDELPKISNRVVCERLLMERAYTGLLTVNHVQDFPGGSVVKNPPVNAGDMGSSPGPERSHMPRSN